MIYLQFLHRLDTRQRLASRVPAMKQKHPRTKQLSRTAEMELQRLIVLCRKMQLSAAKIRKIRRIVRIMFDDPPDGSESS